MGQGREAATVRQLVLVIVLVGAAFLGGAFVNGPGLRWVQAQVIAVQAPEAVAMLQRSLADLFDPPARKPRRESATGE